MQIVDELTGNEGNIIWRMKAARMYAKPLADGFGTIHGSWEIIGGTGIYEGSSGQGHFEGTFNGSIGEMHATYDGTISLSD